MLSAGMVVLSSWTSRAMLIGLARIAPETDLGGRGAAQLLGDDVEMEDRHAGGQQRVAPRRDLAELAADDDEAVGRRDEIVGDARIAAEETGREWVGASDGALAAHRMGDRDGAGFGEALQRLMGEREMNAAADQE